MQRVYGEIPPTVKFVVFETRKTAHDSVGPEYKYMPVENAEDVVKSIDSHTNTEWFPKDMVRSGDAKDMERGAGRIRALGRLSLWANVNEINNAIMNTFGRITDGEVRGKATEKYELMPQTYVYIVGSLVGGTGSGTLIDIAYLVRNITAESNVKGIFVFPFKMSIPPEENERILNANAYSTLKELDYFLNKRKFEFPFGNIGEIKDRPPFDFIYLIDELVEDESISIQYSDAIKMISTLIETEVGTRIGVELDAKLKDILKFISEHYDNRGKIRPYIKAYNTFSTYSLTFPAERISDVCTYRFMVHLLGSLLEKSEDVGNKVDAFLTQKIGENGYSIKNPYERLKIEEKIESAPVFNAKSKDLVGDIERWQQKIEKRLKEDEGIYPRIDKLKDGMVKEVEEILRDTARDLMQNPPYCKDFLDQLKAKIQSYKNMLEDENKDDSIPGDKKSLERNERIIKSYKENLKEARKKRKKKEEYEALVKAIISDNEKKIEVYKKEAIYDLYVNILDICGDENKNLIRDAKIVENMVTRMRDKGIEMDTSITTELERGRITAREKWVGADNDKVGKIYEKYAPDISSVKDEFLKGRSLYEWINKEEEKIFDEIFEYSANKFKKIGEMHIVDFLDEWYKKEEDIKGELKNLIDNTKPFWRYTPLDGFLPQQDLKAIRVVGINDLDKSKGIIDSVREIEIGISPINIADNQKIISTIYKYGLPIVGFRNIIDYKADYDSERERIAFTTDVRIDFPEIDKEGPTARIIDLIPNPTSGPKSAILKAEIDDSKAGNSPIVAAEYFIDETGDYGSGTPMKASDERFDTPIERVEVEIDISEFDAGKHMIFVRGKDAGGNWGDFASRELEVTEA